MPIAQAADDSFRLFPEGPRSFVDRDAAEDAIAVERHTRPAYALLLLAGPYTADRDTIHRTPPRKGTHVAVHNDTATRFQKCAHHDPFHSST